MVRKHDDFMAEGKELTSSPKSSPNSAAPPGPPRTGSVTRSTAIRTLTSCTVPGSRATENGVESDDGPDRTVTGEDDVIRSAERRVILVVRLIYAGVLRA